MVQIGHCLSATVSPGGQPRTASARYKILVNELEAQGSLMARELRGRLLLRYNEMDYNHFVPNSASGRSHKNVRIC